MADSASDPAAFPYAAEAYAHAWEQTRDQLREWLIVKRFPCRPAEAADVFDEARASLAKDNWAACRVERANEDRTGSQRPASRRPVSSQSDAARKHLTVAYTRIVRAIEIRKWSQLILGDDSVPPGPLSLPQHWRARLPSVWSADSPYCTQSIQEALAELARAGWAALGSYGTRSDPASWFLEQLLARLQWRGTWDGLLNNTLGADGLPLTEIFHRQALREFSNPADGDHAFHWAINHLIENKFKAPDIRPVHEVFNPQAFLRKSFAMALNDFRRKAWNPGQLQRPRAEKWMRQLGKDWEDIFTLVVKHARTEDVVQQFLAKATPAGMTEEKPASLAEDATSATPEEAPGEEAQGQAVRSVQPYLAQARQIEKTHRDDPAARVRAIDALWRNYLEHEKKWQRPMAAQSLSSTGDDGEEYEIPLPSTTHDPLMELLCAENRRRLRGVASTAGEASPERRLVRTLLGQGFALTDEDALELRYIIDPPPKKAGRPRKHVQEARARLLARLRHALHEAGIDVSILDSLSVIWDNDDESLPGLPTDRAGDEHDEP